MSTNSAFTIKVKGDETLEVYADISRIEQVVTNFVNNAMKYAPRSKEIKVRIEKLLKEVKVSIIDKGEGISSHNISFLFDRYYRVNHSGSMYTGLGLGLYICAEIIKNMMGRSVQIVK